MKKMKTRLFIILIFLVAGQALATDYYLNSYTGNDNNSGTSRLSALKTIDELARITFRPGDTIHVAPGTEYHGTLRLKGSGSPGNPIRLFTDEGGAQASFHGNGASEAVLLQNVQYWEISNIAITNKGTDRQKHIVGLRIMLQDCGVANHIYINNVTVSDVYASLDKNTEGHGILAQNISGPKAFKSRFNDLRIENCKLIRTDRNGICMQSSFINRKTDWFASTNVVIRGNTIEDCGGDAIKTWGCDGAIIEHNFVNGFRQRCEDYAAGIWPWSCDNTTIQYNEVTKGKGTKDGQSFDSDYNCNNTIIQYNYSHDNEGGFLLVCGPKLADSNIGCNNTIVRFNISQNDGINSARVFHISGGSVKDTYIYNNVIYLNDDQSVPMVKFGNWDGFATNTHFYNNIFYVKGETSYQLQGGTNTIFQNNLFFGTHNNAPDDKAAVYEDPLFTNPGSGKDGYKLLPDSPALHAGGHLQNIGPHDYYNNKIFTNTPTSIGVEIK